MLKLEVGGVVGRIAVLSALAGLSGCGGSDGGEEPGGSSPSTASAFSGVYELTSFTENEAGCDAEGASVLEQKQDRFFVVAPAVTLGARRVALVSCETVEECGQKARAIETNGTTFMEYYFTLSSEIDATRIAGFEATSGFWERDGTCTGRTFSDHLMTLAASSVRLDSRTKLLADRPQEDGACWVSPAESMSEAAGLPCSNLRVLQGSKVQ